MRSCPEQTGELLVALKFKGMSLTWTFIKFEVTLQLGFAILSASAPVNLK
jgi:hypothetical protein